MLPQKILNISQKKRVNWKNQVEGNSIFYTNLLPLAHVSMYFNNFGGQVEPRMSKKIRKVLESGGQYRERSERIKKNTTRLSTPFFKPIFTISTVRTNFCRWFLNVQSPYLLAPTNRSQISLEISEKIKKPRDHRLHFPSWFFTICTVRKKFCLHFLDHSYLETTGRFTSQFSKILCYDFSYKFSQILIEEIFCST